MYTTQKQNSAESKPAARETDFKKDYDSPTQQCSLLNCQKKKKLKNELGDTITLQILTPSNFHLFDPLKDALHGK